MESLKRGVTIDYRWIIAALLAIIIGMLALWQPWQSTQNSKSRTITVSGEATVKATPDQYVFYPSYSFSAATEAAAIAKASSKSETVVAAVKKLGVADSAIKTSAGGYSDKGVSVEPSTGEDDSKNYTYTLSITITVSDKALAQKVQDYIATTGPVGQVTPQADFSTSMRKDVEDKARNLATKDARTKAQQSAKNLGFSVAGVKSVSDSGGFDGYMPMYRAMDTGVSSEQGSFSLQPGENELSYTVRVVYYIR